MGVVWAPGLQAFKMMGSWAPATPPFGGLIFILICCRSRYKAIVLSFRDSSTDFYDTGNGVAVRGWSSSQRYNLNSFKNLTNFPNCPESVSDVFDFSFAVINITRNNYFTFETYFVSSQSGDHKLFAIFNAAISIVIDGKEVLASTEKGPDDWAHRYVNQLCI